MNQWKRNVINAADALVKDSSDLRGTSSMSAPPELMRLIDAVDDRNDDAIIEWAVKLAFNQLAGGNCTMAEAIDMCEGENSQTFADLLRALTGEAK